MNKTAAANILSLANSLLATDPEKAYKIVKHLRGLIDDTRIAITMKDIEKNPDLQAQFDDLPKNLQNTLLEVVKPGEIHTLNSVLGENPGNTISDEAADKAVNDMLKGESFARALGKISSSRLLPLVRVAFDHPETRSVLLPIIAARQSLKKSSKKAKTSTKSKPKVNPFTKAPSKKASPKKASPKAPPKSKRHASIDMNLSDARW